MGLALGRIGLSLDDFCRLTFAEFDAVVEAWTEGQAQMRADAWERTRALGVWTLQPHLKKGVRLTPAKLLPLPWDGAVRKGGKRVREESLSPDERKARMERLRTKLSNF